ncbi:MAG: S1 RNA-binding domain-containing protein [Chitinispirillaceae bacterium]|nr:S1 RNA-binding domain-containing protein [Chitinispirillaceae bacterium]
MIEFSKQVAERWNIPVAVAEQVCNAYVKGDSPYYLGEYHLVLSMEMTTSMLWEIYDFLKEIDGLSPKKKRVLNAYKKAKSLSPELERRINLTTNPFELDDLLIPVRPNPRSRGQIAAGKGLKPFAERILAQSDVATPIEEIAASSIGKDPSLASVGEVILGIKDVLAEMIAYDETVRAMAREVAFEDGFFEIIPKNKKDPTFTPYLGRQVPFNELLNEELLRLFTAEEKKLVRLKVGIQLFRITELLRHHFITNPDASGFDLICETIDESWLRLLQPIVERDVKTRLHLHAQAWAYRHVTGDLEKAYAEELARGHMLVVDAGLPKQVSFIAVSGRGELLGTTTERKPPDGKPVVSERLKQFAIRYRAERIAVTQNNDTAFANALLEQVFAGWEAVPEIVPYKRDAAADAARCEWIYREFATLLDETMKKMYADALLILKPIFLLPKVGSEFYSVHALQPLLPQHRFLEIVNRIRTSAQLNAGVSIKEIADFSVNHITAVSSKQVQAIKAADNEGLIGTKNDMLKVPGITEVAFRNMSGFLIIPGAELLLDRTVVHPDYFDWFDDIAEQLNISIETIVTEPEYLHSYMTDDREKKNYIEKKLIGHIAASRRYVLQPPAKVRRKLKLNEVREGAVVSGRVTNITQFGVFVNIHAVCDGLIHISQLADEYVENPEQVVSVNDRVDVRVLRVDVKKRRISLSMRNLGTMAPKVRPSRGQLDNLAEHFKNR